MDSDENEPAAPRIEGFSSSSHPPASRTSPALRVSSLRAPASIRPGSLTTPSISVLSEATPPPTLLTASGASLPTSQRTPLLFICVDCWRTFNDGSLSTCTCEKSRPPGGWAAMPYLFRGRYLFVELLGRGGMGAVFSAYDQAAHESPWVALKVVQQGRPELALMLKEMFQKEVAAAQMLAQHKQFFVQVLGHDGVDPAYLVLEHVPWQTLEQMLTSLPGTAEWLPPVQVARIGIAVLRGVAKMHFHRIVHRDLTPANIFIHRAEGGEGYDVKITDLGIWAYDQVQGESESMTLVGRRPAIEGTPAYMSPEQSVGEPVGAASDLHTLGSVLWELATGVVPFPVSGDMPAYELVEQRVEQLKTPPKRPPGMPEGLYRVLIKALAFDPSKRWASAVEMRKALEAFVNQYHQQRQRDLETSWKSLEKMSEQVSRLKEKLLPMRGLLERLGHLGAVLREIREHREECEPEALRGIAESTSQQLDEIRGELNALASWLEFVAGHTGRTVVRPVREEEPPATVRAFEHQPWLERSPWVSVAIAALFALLLCVGYLLGRPSSDARSSSPPSPVAPAASPAAVETTAITPGTTITVSPKSDPEPSPLAAPASSEPSKASAPATASAPAAASAPASTSSSKKGSTGASSKPKPPPPKEPAQDPYAPPPAARDPSSESDAQRDLIRKNPYE